ncbi:putative salicylate O-methyltransferase-like [Capsicum annuum]|nr:putative salicylate O-methyltransferase-like [Capsicum annuum]
MSYFSLIEFNFVPLVVFRGFRIVGVCRCTGRIILVLAFGILETTSLPPRGSGKVWIYTSRIPLVGFRWKQKEGIDGQVCIGVNLFSYIVKQSHFTSCCRVRCIVRAICSKCLDTIEGLHNLCSFIGKPNSSSTRRFPPLKHFFHSTGTCYSPERDYYEILGVTRDSSRDEIKKAFHVLAKKYHPDANKNNPSAKRKFQDIRDAYEMKEQPSNTEDINYNYGNGNDFRYSYKTQFSDSFQKIFSEVELSLSFSEAAKGCTKHLSFDADVPCDSCNGTGYPLNSKPRECPTCQGIGRERCRACKASGVVEAIKDVKVTIPAGVDSGDTIRVPKAGHAGRRGMQPGSLFIKLKVHDPHLIHVLLLMGDGYEVGTNEARHDQDMLSPNLIGHADVGYLSDPYKARSQIGYVFICGVTAISWRYTKQSIVATSSNHAEIIAIHEASRECIRSTDNVTDLFTKSSSIATFKKMLHKIGRQKFKDVLIRGSKYALYSFSLSRFCPTEFSFKAWTLGQVLDDRVKINAHLFLHFKTAANLWNMFFCILGVNRVMPRTTLELLKCWNGVGRRGSTEDWWKRLPACIWWTLWKEQIWSCRCAWEEIEACLLSAGEETETTLSAGEEATNDDD